MPGCQCCSAHKEASSPTLDVVEAVQMEAWLCNIGLLLADFNRPIDECLADFATEPAKDVHWEPSCIYY